VVPWVKEAYNQSGILARNGATSQRGNLADEDGGFASVLRRHRLRANLTHEALAARSGLSVDTISALERGVHLTPRRSTLVALAQAMRLPGPAREEFFAAAEPPPAVRPRRDPRTVPPSYPRAIAADWSEAHAALAAGLRRAATAMALRAIQGVCVEQGVTGDTSLLGRIAELGRAHAFHPTLIEWAKEIRLLGSAAVQGGVDGLDGVTPQDAATVVSFLDELLRLTYEVLERLGRLMSGTSPA
jgi:transcriptional regulator with XRE-family HTH domain